MILRNYNDFINESKKDAMFSELKKFEMFSTQEQIIDWLKEVKVKNYIINDDLTVDVDDDVIFGGKQLYWIPVQFNKINGDFECDRNNLQSLKGCPVHVEGDFKCMRNIWLKSLKYSPKYIKGDFEFWGCAVSSLKGISEYVGENIFGSNNSIEKIDAWPKKFNGEMHLNNCNIKNIDKVNPKYDLTKLFLDYTDDLYWNWLAKNLMKDPSLIQYNIKWIKENDEWMPDFFKDEFEHLIEIYDYTYNDN